MQIIQYRRKLERLLLLATSTLIYYLRTKIGAYPLLQIMLYRSKLERLELLVTSNLV